MDLFMYAFVLIGAAMVVTSQLPPDVVPVEPLSGSAAPDYACTMPLEPGPCRGYFPRYFYNTDSSMCEHFVYGGCQGNDNNFVTIEECQKLCITN